MARLSGSLWRLMQDLLCESKPWIIAELKLRMSLEVEREEQCGQSAQAYGPWSELLERGVNWDYIGAPARFGSRLAPVVRYGSRWLHAGQALC